MNVMIHPASFSSKNLGLSNSEAMYVQADVHGRTTPRYLLEAHQLTTADESHERRHIKGRGKLVLCSNSNKYGPMS